MEFVKNYCHPDSSASSIVSEQQVLTHIITENGQNFGQKINELLKEVIDGFPTKIEELLKEFQGFSKCRAESQ